MKQFAELQNRFLTVAIDYSVKILVENRSKVQFQAIMEIFYEIVCFIALISDRLSMPTNISADIYALMTSCWNTIPSSRPTINQVQQRLKQSIKSEILATPRVSLSLNSGQDLIYLLFRVRSHSKDLNPPNSFMYRQAKRQLVAKNYKYP